MQARRDHTASGISRQHRAVKNIACCTIRRPSGQNGIVGGPTGSCGCALWDVVRHFGQACVTSHSSILEQSGLWNYAIRYTIAHNLGTHGLSPKTDTGVGRTPDGARAGSSDYYDGNCPRMYGAVVLVGARALKCVLKRSPDLYNPGIELGVCSIARGAARYCV